MNKSITAILMGLAFLMVSPAQSAVLGVSGQGEIIGAPANVDDEARGGVSNTLIQAFDEQQSVLLATDLTVDGGTVVAGTRVDSHMLFYNPVNSTTVSNRTATFTFSGNIIGLMTDTNGNLEAASSSLLGATGTSYPGPFSYRGLENDNTDSFTVSGNTLTITMYASNPGDWIRVVTATPVPEPSTWLMLGLAMLTVMGLRRRLV